MSLLLQFCLQIAKYFMYENIVVIQIRVDALGLLCESKKTTNAPTTEELQMILSFMEFNMNSQSPLFRQQVLTLFKKVMSSSTVVMLV